MSLLVSARSFSINLITSLATRSLISKYADLTSSQILIFNGVDMTVNAVSSYLFNKDLKSTDALDLPIAGKLIASRAISATSGMIITYYIVGGIPLGTAVALNYISVMAGLILRGIETCVDEEDIPNVRTLFVFA